MADEKELTPKLADNSVASSVKALPRASLAPFRKSPPKPRIGYCLVRIDPSLPDTSAVEPNETFTRDSVMLPEVVNEVIDIMCKQEPIHAPDPTMTKVDDISNKAHQMTSKAHSSANIKCTTCKISKAAIEDGDEGEGSGSTVHQQPPARTKPLWNMKHVRKLFSKCLQKQP